MTDTFLNLLHSGAVDAEQFTDKDRRALLDLLKKSLNSGGGGRTSMRLTQPGNRLDSSSISSWVSYSRSGVRALGSRALTPASAGVT